ncbi:hypothetical protein IQ07DRAFT_586532 [Pyrenochaeta sp. DS3sAY3a]|nr:hypothetical protein IQ07DRAFT_586532 [Pyrenochaeta sp. DS3sAY3a]
MVARQASHPPPALPFHPASVLMGYPDSRYEPFSRFPPSNSIRLVEAQRQVVRGSLSRIA